MKGSDKQKKDDNGKSDYEREQFSKKIFIPTKEHENIVNISLPNDENTDESKKGVAIYRIELNKCQKEENKNEEKEKGKQENYVLSAAVTCYSCNKISGICKFIEDSNDDDSSKDDSNLY
ncbi:unnamed protein product [Rhizophagus irregularis]|nr:unnamed protein product [Rhizophagus irregularis]